jgi:hypothetical protein
MVPRSERDWERSKSSSRTGALALLLVIGKGCPAKLNVETASVGLNLQIVLLAQEPLAAADWFRIVRTGFASVTVRLLYVPEGIGRLARSDMSTCSRLISTETGFVSKLTSPGCNTAPAMVTENERTATPAGGVSRIRSVATGVGGGGAGLTVTLAEPNFVESLTEVAVTVTVGELETLEGAVYLPVGSIVPQLAPEQPVPETLQLTTWLAPLGFTAAVNCWTPLT